MHLANFWSLHWAWATGLLIATLSPQAMSAQASPIYTRKFFNDPRLAEFADHIQKGDLAQVQAGLRAGISPNAQGLQGFTPLFFVFPAKTSDVARELLKAGANPNAKLEDGTPALQFSVRFENVEFTKALLEFKADPNAQGANEKPVSELFAAFERRGVKLPCTDQAQRFK